MAQEKSAEQNIRELKELDCQINNLCCDLIADSMNIGLAVLNDQEEFIHINNQLCDMLQYRRTELTGSPFSKILPPDCPEQCCLNLPDETEWEMKRDIVLQNREGRLCPLYLTVQSLSRWNSDFPDSLYLLIFTLRKNSQEKQLSKQLISLIEKDRHRIAMELHDQIGQNLISCKMHLGMIIRQQDSEESGLSFQLRFLEERVEKLLMDIKQISQGLRPGMIEYLGLIPALRNLFSEVMADHNIKIHFFESRIPKRFDQEKELTVYRICQEALNNIVKYARTERVFVNLVMKGDRLLLNVEDEGIGFDLQEIMVTSSGWKTMGLHIMKERVEQVGGEMTIESKRGNGTVVSVDIPL